MTEFRNEGHLYLREYELQTFLLRFQEAVEFGYRLEDIPSVEDYPIANPFGGFSVGMILPVECDEKASSKPKPAKKATVAPTT